MILLILIFEANFSVGQNLFFSVDSITKSQVKLLPNQFKSKFDTILNYRKQSLLHIRIDTMKFDYLFIQETFCRFDTTLNITERYFLNNDTIPKYVFINGKFIDPKRLYDKYSIWYWAIEKSNFTLYPMIEEYSKLEAVQQLPYFKTQIIYHGCVVHKGYEKELKRRRYNELKTTYQIQTILGHNNLPIKISLQLPPRHPRFKTYDSDGF